MTLVAGDGAGYRDGSIMQAQFNGPMGLDFDAAGNLYVADYQNRRIRRIGVDGQVTTLPGRLPLLGNPYGPLDYFDLPTDVVVDSEGTIYVTEMNGTISKIQNAVVSLIAGSPERGSIIDGEGASARFLDPTSVALDLNDNLIVADRSNGAIRRVTPAGVVSTLATDVGAPQGVEVDLMGNILVASPRRRLQKIDTDNTFSESLLAGPEPRELTTVAIDNQGLIYLGDYVFDAYWQLRVVTKTNWLESVPLDQKINIAGMAVHPDGSIYVSDYIDHKIWKITLL